MAQAPALEGSQRLYLHLLKLGFKIYLLRGRDESQRKVTLKNLASFDYHSWEELMLRVPRIYEHWSDCHVQVHGYGGACYNRFDSLAEAEEPFANYNAAQQSHGNFPLPAPLQPQHAPLHQQSAPPPAPPATLVPPPAAAPMMLNPQPIFPNAQEVCVHYAMKPFPL